MFALCALSPAYNSTMDNADDKLHEDSFFVHNRLLLDLLDDSVAMGPGTIVEVGTHDELMTRGGMYYNLYTMQWKGQGDIAAI
jgi:ABC-type transport system involved in Fe-S cluster assembly fused permease/ATPase subunit